MKFVVRALALAALAALCAAAQPTIYTRGIVNGASFVQYGLPNGNIAQGSIFSIFGTNIGPAVSPSLSFPLTTDLGGVKVHVLPQGASTPIDAILLLVTAGQINAVLPSTVPAGTATVTVEFGGQTSGPQTITVVPSSVGVFAVNQGGTGPAAVLNFNAENNQPQNAVNQAAHPGQVLVLWGTGLGPVNYDEKQNPAGKAYDMKGDVSPTVYVSGRAITAQYAGRSPQFAGVDQINFQLPSDIVTGCYVPVTVKVAGIVSNSTSLSIAPAGTSVCSDALTQLPSSFNQDYRVGVIALSSISTSALGMSFSMDTASGSFIKYAAAAVGRLRGNFGVSTYGACTVYTYQGESATFADNTPFTYLDAGPQLTLTLPDQSTKTLTQSTLTPGVYSIPFTGGLPTPFLVPGQYEIRAPGGTGPNAVGDFDARLVVPERLTWTNMTTLPSPIPRSSGLQVTWTGGDPNDAIIILGNSTLADASAGAGFYCLAKGSDLKFTIPADVLSALPVSGTDMGFLGIADFPTSSKFKINPTPSGLDVAMFTYQFVSATSVMYQ